MQTRRIAVTGTDGTGKTTIIRILQKRFADQPTRVKAFRSPQYHEDPDVPFQRLSNALDAMGEFADTTRHLELKATSLFLQMTLFGDVERHMESAYRPQWVISERQCLCDSLVYARFYKPLMQRNLDEVALRPALEKELGASGLAAIENWVAGLPARIGTDQPLTVWQTPLFALGVFDAQPADLLPRLMAVYQASLPDVIVVLTASAEALSERIAAKATTKTPPELHEKAHILTMFQAGLQQVATGLKQAKPGLVVHIIDTTDQTEEQTASAVAALVEVA